MCLNLSAWITLLIQKHSAGAKSSVCTWVVWWIKASLSYKNAQKDVCQVYFRTVHIRTTRMKMTKNKIIIFKKGWVRKKKIPRAVWHVGSVLLWYEPFGKGYSAALGPGYQQFSLNLPLGFLSDVLCCVLDWKWYLTFGSFFLQAYLIMAPQTTIATLPGVGGQCEWMIVQLL